MRIEKEVGEILEGSKFIKKSDFIEAVKRSAETDPNLSEDWRKALTTDRIIGDFWEFDQNAKWFLRSYEENKKKYSGQHVFIYDQKVVFSTGDDKEALAQNKILSLDPRYDQYFVCYVPTPEENISLIKLLLE